MKNIYRTSSNQELILTEEQARQYKKLDKHTKLVAKDIKQPTESPIREIPVPEEAKPKSK